MPHNIEYLLCPRSVAVIGASRKRGTVGGELFYNLIRCGFQGPVFPVNPTASVIQSVKAYRDIEAIPDPVDLAVLIVPAHVAKPTLEACGRKGVKAAIIISAGFKEVGGEGVQREKELVEVARKHGLRLLGPNCLGVLNTSPEIQLNATFADSFPNPGPVALLSQSGALGAVILDLATRRRIGFSTFVSVGNKCDVSGNDLLEYWEEDPQTRVITMYLESFGNPRRFTQIARRVARTKPIVVVKSGRTSAGSAAAASHTGSLAGTDVAVDALLGQAGVIRVDSTEELFDTAMLLASQPVPRGDRVAIVTNAGGPGILAADACETRRLRLPHLEERTVETLRSFLPAEASIRNPVDMIASANGDHYGRAVRAMLADKNVDSVMVIFVPPLMIEIREVAQAIGEAAIGADKPIVACYMGAHGFPEGLQSAGNQVQIPSYRFPEQAAAALHRVTGYAEWLEHADSPVPWVDVDRGLAAATVEACRDSVLSEEQQVSWLQWLDAADVPRLLGAYGIRFPETAIATTADHAAKVASSIGFPVALKVVSSQITHKTDVGGVALDLRDADEVRRAYAGILAKAAAANLEEAVEGVLVQQFVRQGIEAVVGVTQDPLFGPLIMFGLGGAYVELVRDVVFRLHPLTEHDVDSMLSSVRSADLLHGYRGQPPGDVPALRDLLFRVSQMVSDIPELLEMDLNPVKLLPPGQGCVAVDARIRLGHPWANPFTRND